MIRLAYGMPGAGKSTLLHDFVRVEAPAQRFFVKAHSLEWNRESGHWRGRPPESLRVITGPDAFERFKGEDIPETGVFVFLNVEAEHVVQLVKAKGASVYVDDEIDLIARRQGWDESSLRAIVHQGRHLQSERGDFTECHVMGACRRPQNLHTDLTDLADEVFVFRLKGGNTRKRLLMDSLIEDDGEWDQLTELPDFHFKHVGPKGHVWLSIPPLPPKPKVGRENTGGNLGVPTDFST